MCVIAPIFGFIAKWTLKHVRQLLFAGIIRQTNVRVALPLAVVRPRHLLEVDKTGRQRVLASSDLLLAGTP